MATGDGAAAMPSALRGEAAFTAEGARWTLVCDMDAIERFESGRDAPSLIDVLAQMRFPTVLGSPKLTHLVRLLSAMMHRHHADALPDRDAMCRMVNGAAMAAMRAALANGFPDDAAGEADGDDGAGEA